MLGGIVAEAAARTAVLAQPGPDPRWLLVLLIVMLAAAGPGSMVGIDISRTNNPSGRLGVAQSMTTPAASWRRCSCRAGWGRS